MQQQSTGRYPLPDGYEWIDNASGAMFTITGNDLVLVVSPIPGSRVYVYEL